MDTDWIVAFLKLLCYIVNNMMTKINLEQLGFSKKEASVYLASLELGASSVQKIAEQAQVNRVTTYVIIEGIKSKVIYTSSEGEIKNASSTKEV